MLLTKFRNFNYGVKKMCVCHAENMKMYTTAIRTLTDMCIRLLSPCPLSPGWSSWETDSTTSLMEWPSGLLSLLTLPAASAPLLLSSATSFLTNLVIHVYLLVHHRVEVKLGLTCLILHLTSKILRESNLFANCVLFYISSIYL